MADEWLRKWASEHPESASLALVKLNYPTPSEVDDDVMGIDELLQLADLTPAKIPPVTLSGSLINGPTVIVNGMDVMSCGKSVIVLDYLSFKFCMQVVSSLVTGEGMTCDMVTTTIKTVAYQRLVAIGEMADIPGLDILTVGTTVLGSDEDNTVSSKVAKQVIRVLTHASPVRIHAYTTDRILHCPRLLVAYVRFNLDHPLLSTRIPITAHVLHQPILIFEGNLYSRFLVDDKGAQILCVPVGAGLDSMFTIDSLYMCL